MVVELISLGWDELLEVAENLKIAWDLPENINNEQLALIISRYLQSWLEDFCEHPDFFLRDNSKIKQEITGLSEEAETMIFAA